MSTTVISVLLNVSNSSILNDSMKNGTFDNGCERYEDAQHVLFQLANFILVLSFLAPSSYRFHTLLLRSFVSAGSLLIVFWAGMITCYPDVLGWNLVFLFVNSVYLAWIMYKHYPPKIHKDLETLYVKVFKPFKVTRKSFVALTDIGELRSMVEGEEYATEMVTQCNQFLSIVVRGRFIVSSDEYDLHHIEVNQFMDSPEFEAGAFDGPDKQEKCQVTIRTLEESLILSWQSEKLRQFLKSKIYLAEVFRNLLGKDITVKLYQVQQTLHRKRLLSKQLARPSSLVDIRSNIIANNHTEKHVKDILIGAPKAYKFGKGYIETKHESQRRYGSFHGGSRDSFHSNPRDSYRATSIRSIQQPGQSQEPRETYV